MGGRSGGVGCGGDGVAFSDAEGGGLPVADSNLNVVERVSVAGGEGEIKGWILVDGDAGLR